MRSRIRVHLEASTRSMQLADPYMRACMRVCVYVFSES